MIEIPDTDHEAAQRRLLRRNRGLATGLLLFAATLVHGIALRARTGLLGGTGACRIGSGHRRRPGRLVRRDRPVPPAAGAADPSYRHHPQQQGQDRRWSWKLRGAQFPGAVPGRGQAAIDRPGKPHGALAERAGNRGGTGGPPDHDAAHPYPVDRGPGTARLLRQGAGRAVARHRNQPPAWQGVGRTGFKRPAPAAAGARGGMGADPDGPQPGPPGIHGRTAQRLVDTEGDRPASRPGRSVRARRSS